MEWLLPSSENLCSLSTARHWTNNWTLVCEHTLQAYRFIDPLFREKKKYSHRKVSFISSTTKGLSYTNEYDGEKKLYLSVRKNLEYSTKTNILLLCVATDEMKPKIERDRWRREKNWKRSESTFGQQFKKSSSACSMFYIWQPTKIYTVFMLWNGLNMGFQ